MELIENIPNDSRLQIYVDRYQYFRTDDITYFHTVPNGRLDLYWVKNGSFSYWNQNQNKLFEAASSGYFPIQDKAALYVIPKNLEAFNIKFKLPILGIEAFNDLLKNPALATLSEGKINSFIEDISSEFMHHAAINVETIDKLLIQLINSSQVISSLSELFQLLESHNNRLIKTAEVAEQLNLSVKTLERTIAKNLNMTPKRLWSVIRFHTLSSELHSQESSDFSTAFDYGFYDQSHFIKECKKLTGLTPKAFFRRLHMETNDVIFKSNMN